MISYFANRKATFAADNNAAVGAVIYTITVIVLIAVESAAGTPLADAMIYALIGDTPKGALYQLCKTLSQMMLCTADAVIIFLMDKYVIITKQRKKQKETDVSFFSAARIRGADYIIFATSMRNSFVDTLRLPSSLERR